MCRQVVVTENVVVPARHEINVPVKMTDGDIPHPAKNWVIETKQLSSRVMAARTLIDVKEEQLVARICNYSDEPYACLLYTSPSPRDRTRSRMPSSA